MRQVAPTKTNLLKTKSELSFARLGFELLDQKRNILILELLNLVDQATRHQEKVEKCIAEAHQSLKDAVVAMGRNRLMSLSTVVNIQSDITIKLRKVMGVSLPIVETEFNEHPPYFSLLDTNFHIDGAMAGFKAALELMGKLAELKVSIMRLAREIKKTIRKVNALEKIAIPDLAETLTYIENRLEENERDMFVLMKIVKNRLAGEQEDEE